MVAIKKQLVASRKSTYSGKNPCKYITIHETGNTSKGANAQAHANLQSNGWSASWHYTVDDKQIIQSFPDSVQCWHAGDGKGKGNTESIGIEICVNSDGDFGKAVQNAVLLTRHLMSEHNISANNVVQHNHWSGKDCPKNLRANKGIAWNSFKRQLEAKQGLYRVQVGAYSIRANADKLAKELKAKGYDTHITFTG